MILRGRTSQPPQFRAPPAATKSGRAAVSTPAVASRSLGFPARETTVSVSTLVLTVTLTVSVVRSVTGQVTVTGLEAHSPSRAAARASSSRRVRRCKGHCCTRTRQRPSGHRPQGGSRPRESPSGRCRRLRQAKVMPNRSAWARPKPAPLIRSARWMPQRPHRSAFPDASVIRRS